MGLHPLSDCENCPLYNNAEFMGYSEPDHKYDLVIVGGVANKREQFLGGFFNTDAGKLLRRIFKHVGVNPNPYYTTAILCRPPQGTKIPAKAVACCRPRVIDEITRASAQDDPPTVVTLGNEGALSVLGASGVTTLRVGGSKRSEWLNSEQRVVPTVNPWATMKAHAQFPNLVADIKKAFYEQPAFVEPNYTVIKTEKEAGEFFLTLVTLPSRSDVTIDIECVLDKDSSFGHPERHKMLCVGIQIEDDDPVVFTAEALTETTWKQLKYILLGSNVIAQNGKFDLNGIRPLVGKIKLGFDTMLASYCLDERTGIHGLKSMAQEILNAPPWDDEIKKYIGPERRFDRIPKNLLYKYNAYDVRVTKMLKDYFYKLLVEQDLLELHNFLCEASNMLMDVEYGGITIDKKYLEELVEKFEYEIMSMEHHLSVMAYSVRPEGYLKGDGINPRSPLQIKKFFMDNGIELQSTDEDHMQELLDYPKKFPKNDKLVRDFATMLLKFRGDSKLNDTYIMGVKDRLYKGRINSSYLLHGTTTGRLSSRNPNLQNIPRDSPIKKMYVAKDEDHVIVHSDYSQAELRVLSWLAGDKYFRDIFNAGDIDVFDELVPVLFPGSRKSTMDKAECKEKRTMVKTYVYGLSYGRTEYGIARGFGIPVETAAGHMKKFFSVIPEIISWQNWVKDEVLSGRDLVNPYGRHRRYPLITDENKKDILNESLAFLPQSTASDMCLSAAIQLNKDFSDTGIGHYEDFKFQTKPRIINLVHDDIIGECHIKDAERVMRMMESRMVESAQKIVGDYVKFESASSYANSWGDLD